jgi:hypothetical protein
MDRRTFIVGALLAIADTAVSSSKRMLDFDHYRMMETGGIDCLIHDCMESGYDIRQLLDKVAGFKFLPGVKNMFAMPCEKRQWQIYWDSLDFQQKSSYLSGCREKWKNSGSFAFIAKNIASFMQDNMETLVESETIYGIEKEYAAAIIGIETKFGRILGDYNPFNALVSLYCTRDDKRDWAQKELVEYLRWSSRNGYDPLNVQSSYAAAVGKPQFIPSSLNRFFVGNDPFDTGQSIMSVQNFLAFHKLLHGTMDKAVFSYNRSLSYVQQVEYTKDFAKALGRPKSRSKSA